MLKQINFVKLQISGSKLGIEPVKLLHSIAVNADGVIGHIFLLKVLQENLQSPTLKFSKKSV